MKITITRDGFNNYMEKPLAAFVTLISYSTMFVEDEVANCPEKFKNFLPDFKKRGPKLFSSIEVVLSKVFGTSIEEAADIYLNGEFSDKVLENFEISQEEAELFKQVLESLKECVGDFCSAFDIDEDDINTLILSNDNGTFVKLLSKYREKYNSSAIVGILPSIKSLFYSIVSAEDYINEISEKTEENNSLEPKSLNIPLDFFAKTFSDFITNFNNLNETLLDSYGKKFNVDLKILPEKLRVKTQEEARSIGTVINDHKVASRAIINLVEFFADIIKVDKDLLLEKINNEDVESLVRGKYLVVYLTEDKTKYGYDYMYNNLFDNLTYYYYLFETFDSTGFPATSFFKSSYLFSVEDKTEYVNNAIKAAEEHNALQVFIDSIKILPETTCASDKVFYLFDRCYGFDSKLINSIGKFSTECKPLIGDLCLYFEIADSKEEADKLCNEFMNNDCHLLNAGDAEKEANNYVRKEPSIQEQLSNYGAVFTKTTKEPKAEKPTEKNKKLSYDGSTFSRMINDLWTKFNDYEKDFLNLYQRKSNLSFPDMPELDNLEALKVYKDITLIVKAKENLLSKLSKLLSLSKEEILEILKKGKALTQNKVSFILNKDEGLSAEEVEESIIKPLYICYKMGYQPRFLEDLSLLYGNAEETFECCYSDNESCLNYLKDYLTVILEKDSIKVRDEFDSLLLALKYANQDTQEKCEDLEDTDKLALYQDIIENINVATEFINNYLSSAKSLEYSASEGIPASELTNKFIVPISKAKDLLIDNVYCSSFDLKLKLIRAVNSSFSILEKVFGVEELSSELDGYLKTN